MFNQHYQLVFMFGPYPNLFQPITELARPQVSTRGRFLLPLPFSFLSLLAKPSAPHPPAAGLNRVQVLHDDPFSLACAPRRPRVASPIKSECSSPYVIATSSPLERSSSYVLAASPSLAPPCLSRSATTKSQAKATGAHRCIVPPLPCSCGPCRRTLSYSRATRSATAPHASAHVRPSVLPLPYRRQPESLRRTLPLPCPPPPAPPCASPGAQGHREEQKMSSALLPLPGEIPATTVPLYHG
jgi:hypothetical protein